MSDQLSLAAGTQNKALSQWFTPRETAERIVRWAEPTRRLDRSAWKILEPSAGRGALIRALLDEYTTGPVPTIEALDIDAGNVDAIEDSFSKFYVLAHQADFLSWESTTRFDVAIMNPPFEGGQTERHIMHALKFSDRVVCHCPLTTLEGKARRENLWSKVHLHRLAICSSRPKYGAGSGATAMCTIDVTLHDPRVEAYTAVEWWP